MNGSWYSVVSHATVTGRFTQTGSSVTGTVGWANYGIGSFQWTVSGSVNGTAFSLNGTSSSSGPFPSKIKLSGQIINDSFGPGLAVSSSPFGSFAYRPSKSLVHKKKSKKPAAKGRTRRKSA